MSEAIQQILASIDNSPGDTVGYLGCVFCPACGEEEWSIFAEECRTVQICKECGHRHHMANMTAEQQVKLDEHNRNHRRSEEIRKLRSENHKLREQLTELTTRKESTP